MLKLSQFTFWIVKELSTNFSDVNGINVKTNHFGYNLLDDPQIDSIQIAPFNFIKFWIQ